MENLKVSVIQTYLSWEDKIRNLHHFEGIINNLNDDSDLVVLPEMFSTGFTNNTSLAEDFETSHTKAWMLGLAAKHNLVIMGSFIASVNGTFFNRLLVAFPDGSSIFYDKRHLFSLAKENEYYQAGNKQVYFDLKGWRICPLVCYDLRFPVWSRQPKTPYDLLIYVANWPKKRIKHWTRLLRARAIENQAYVVGVNRIGTDGNGLRYNGSSCVFDAFGDWMANAEDEHEVINVVFNKIKLHHIRSQFPFLADADDFNIQL